MFRFRFVVVLVCSFTLLFGPAFAQQPASPPISAQALLQQSLAAQLGNTQISDVTLTGTARRIAGSDDESGSGILKALNTGEARVDLNFLSGSRSEVVAVANKCLSGSWSGPDGIPHAISTHNLMTDSSWFFPAFTLGRLNSSAKYTIVTVGHETHNDQAVDHIIAYQSSSVQLPPGVPSFSHLTQMDLFLDSGTLLPTALTFNIHPDNDAGLDIPVEVRFSDYRVVGGVQVPFHVQRFINNSLSLDLQFQNASLNTGIAAAQLGGAQ